MPFVTDIYPPAREIEAAAGLGLAAGARKGKGFLGKRQYEAIEVLGRFTVPLRTVSWDKKEEGSTALVVDPHGLLAGSLRFDLLPDSPQAELKEDMGEEDFVALCQQAAKAAAQFSPHTVDLPGLVTEPDQVQPLLKDDGEGAVPAGLEKTVDAARVVAELQKKLAEYESAAAAWEEFKQKLFTCRDRLAAKISTAAAEARAAADKSLADLEQQVRSAVEAKRRETGEAADRARKEHQKQTAQLQAELERFQKQFEETGDELWREKIKAEEERLAAVDKKLAETLEQLNKEETRYAESQQEKIRQFVSERDRRFTAFDQRLKRLDSVLADLAKRVEKRLERFQEQQKKAARLALSLPAEQCDREFPVVFYAARYPGERWQVFPPQLFGTPGIGGKVAGLFGAVNLPFRPATKVGETLAAKLQTLLPGHALEAALVEQNLLKDTGFLNEAKAGLASLVDQGTVKKKHAGLFDEFINPQSDGG